MVQTTHLHTRYMLHLTTYYISTSRFCSSPHSNSCYESAIHHNSAGLLYKHCVSSSDWLQNPKPLKKTDCPIHRIPPCFLWWYYPQLPCLYHPWTIENQIQTSHQHNTTFQIQNPFGLLRKWGKKKNNKSLVFSTQRLTPKLNLRKLLIVSLSASASL